ncbi:hypothetical protein ACYPKM_02390 [Pseudomonas aeruginosa]
MENSESKENAPLDHFIVEWDGLWGRGKSMEDAQRNRVPHFLPNEALPFMPKYAVVHQCTASTRYNEDDRLAFKKGDPEPVRVHPKTLKPIKV